MIGPYFQNRSHRHSSLDALGAIIENLCHSSRRFHQILKTKKQSWGIKSHLFFWTLLRFPESALYWYPCTFLYVIVYNSCCRNVNSKQCKMKTTGNCVFSWRVLDSKQSIRKQKYPLKSGQLGFCGYVQSAKK